MLRAALSVKVVPTKNPLFTPTFAPLIPLVWILLPPASVWFVNRVINSPSGAISLSPSIASFASVMSTVKVKVFRSAI